MPAMIIWEPQLTDITPVTLSGVSTASAAIPAGRTELIQASLISAASLRLYFRIGTACTVATANGVLLDGEKQIISGGAGVTVYFLLTNSAGTAANGGALDYIHRAGLSH